MRYPLDNFVISQGYSPSHRALDLAAQNGTPIRAPESGRIGSVNNDPKIYYGGRYVVLLGDSGYRHYMGHNAANRVRAGQRVNEGQHIADVGMSGYAIPRLGISAPTGPHTHYEVSHNGKQIEFSSIVDKVKQGGNMTIQQLTKIAEDRARELKERDNRIRQLEQQVAQLDDYGKRATQMAEDRLALLRPKAEDVTAMFVPLLGRAARQDELDTYTTHNWPDLVYAVLRSGELVVPKLQARVGELEKTNPDPDMVALGEIMTRIIKKSK